MNCTVTYMSGAGNLFTVLHADELPAESVARYAPLLCDARARIGRPTEGVLVVGTHERRLVVHFFNPDGSSGMMCGNGARCAVQFALDRGLVAAADALTIEMAGTCYAAWQDSGRITVQFPPPRMVIDPLPLELDGETLAVAYVDVGSDHVVLARSDAERWCTRHEHVGDLIGLARQIRHHQDFPRGTNVNLYALSDDTVELSTYERGVEAVTGACGTGALATAVVLWQRKEFHGDTIRLRPPSGEILHIHILADGPTIVGLELSGPATYLAHATIQLPQ